MGDLMMGVMTSDEDVGFTTSADKLFASHCIGKQLKFVWFPKRCHLTRKIIWFKKAYRLTAMWVGPGETMFEHRWHSKKEHIFWELKR